MNRGRRVVLYSARSAFVGGAERSLIRIAGALETARFTPHVVATANGDFVRALTAAELPFSRVPLPDPTWRWPVPFAASVWRLAGLIRRYRVVLLHANDAPAFPAAGLAARVCGLPRLCHVRFTYEAGFLRWLLGRGFERAVFASAYMKRYAQETCPELFPDSRCVVVRNGLEHRLAPSETEVARIRRTIVGDQDGQIVGFFGQVIEVKGVREYLEMAGRLRARFPRVRYLVVGDDKQDGPSFREQMEHHARESGLSGLCLFFGYRADVWPLMHACDVIVMPSHVEPFGNVAVEAGAAARPLVATSVGGLPEIVRDGETGVLCPARAPEALAAAVGRLLENPSEARRLGDQARRHIDTHFTLGRQVSVLQDLYEQVLREHSRR